MRGNFSKWISGEKTDAEMRKERRKERMLEVVSQDEIVSDNIYNLVIGLTITSGFILNVLVSLFMGPIFNGTSYWFSIILYFALSFGGIAIADNSKNAIVSYLGFMLLAFGFSTILSGFFSHYAPQTILHAVYITLAVTVIMMAFSTIFPRFFLSIGETLFISLLATIIVYCITALLTLITGIIYFTIIDFIVAFVFCGYIGYDWAKAQTYPKTIDNAVDASVDLYMDIMNLFVRILSIIGKKD